MPKFESERRPVIRASELDEVVGLLNIYDEITFNGYGEMVALLTTPIPIIGKVVVSYYVRGGHIKIYKDGENPNDNDIWNGDLSQIDYDGKPDRKMERWDIVDFVKRVIRDEVTKQLV